MKPFTLEELLAELPGIEEREATEGCGIQHLTISQYESLLFKTQQDRRTLLMLVDRLRERQPPGA